MGRRRVQKCPESSFCKIRQDGLSLAPYLVWNLNSLSPLKLGITINYGRRMKMHCEVIRYFSEPDTRNLLFLFCETDAWPWVSGTWCPEQKLLPPTSQPLLLHNGSLLSTLHGILGEEGRHEAFLYSILILSKV